MKMTARRAKRINGGKAFQSQEKLSVVVNHCAVKLSGRARLFRFLQYDSRAC